MVPGGRGNPFGEGSSRNVPIGANHN